MNWNARQLWIHIVKISSLISRKFTNLFNLSFRCRKTWSCSSSSSRKQHQLPGIGLVPRFQCHGKRPGFHRYKIGLGFPCMSRDKPWLLMHVTGQPLPSSLMSWGHIYHGKNNVFPYTARDKPWLPMHVTGVVRRSSSLLGS